MEVEEIETALLEACSLCGGKKVSPHAYASDRLNQERHDFQDACLCCNGSGFNKDRVNCPTCGAWMSPGEKERGKCYEHAL